MNVEVVQRRLQESSQLHRKHFQRKDCDGVRPSAKRSSDQDSLESRMLGNLARPVWGGGPGEIPGPTPHLVAQWRRLRGLFPRLQLRRYANCGG